MLRNRQYMIVLVAGLAHQVRKLSFPTIARQPLSIMGIFSNSNCVKKELIGVTAGSITVVKPISAYL